MCKAYEAKLFSLIFLISANCIAEKTPPCRIHGLGGTQPRMMCAIRDFFLNYERLQYKNMIPNALILEGETGTGKTVMTELIAEETEVETRIVRICPIISRTIDLRIAAAEIRSKYEEADEYVKNEKKPFFIVIEEMEAIDARNQESMHDVSKAIIGELNEQIEKHKHDAMVVTIIVINEPACLDKGLSSRCQSIKFSRPDEINRAAILANYLEKHTHQLSDEYIKSIPGKTRRFVGRDIESVFQGASTYARHRNPQYIQDEDFEEALKNRRRQVDQIYPEGFWSNLFGVEEVNEH